MFLKNSDNVGRLEVICGSMFSGKSEELIRRLRRTTYTKQNILIFKHSIDKRYGENGIFSHDKNSLEAYPVSTVEEMEAIINQKVDVEVIGIDEVQFFGPSVVDFCKKYVEYGKKVIVAGLDLDFKAEPFIPMPELLTIADCVTKLKAICSVCGKEAYASQRLINEEPAYKDDPIVLVAAKECYEARCRRHHIVRDRNSKQGKIYFLFGTNIDAGKGLVEEYMKNEDKNKTYKTISIFNEGDSIENIRNCIEKYSNEYDVLFIRIIKSPLIPINGDYSLIDLMSEYRKNSEVILVARNKKGMINEVLICFETLRKADLNLYKVFFTNTDNNEREETIKQIESIIKVDINLI